MTRMFFVRHAQTPCGASGVYCGSGCDVGLTHEGEAAAVALADFLGNIQPDAIFSSPQRRVHETLLPTVARLGLTVHIDWRLREMAYGEWDGKTPHELGQVQSKAFSAWQANPEDSPPPGGERISEVAARIAAGLGDIYREYPHGTVIVASHKTTLRVALCGLLGIDPRFYKDRFAMPLAGVSEITLDDHGARLERHADQSFLPTRLLHLAGS